MAESGVIPPLPASDVMDDEDPFEEAPAQAATTDDLWRGLFGATPEDVTFAPQIPSDAFDPAPPVVNGQKLGAAQMATYVIQRELERAARPLKEALGPSFEQLSRFGYNKPNVDPGAEQLQSMLRRLVRNY